MRDELQKVVSYWSCYSLLASTDKSNTHKWFSGINVLYYIENWSNLQYLDFSEIIFLQDWLGQCLARSKWEVWLCRCSITFFPLEIQLLLLLNTNRKPHVYRFVLNNLTLIITFKVNNSFPIGDTAFITIGQLKVYGLAQIIWPWALQFNVIWQAWHIKCLIICPLLLLRLLLLLDTNAPFLNLIYIPQHSHFPRGEKVPQPRVRDLFGHVSWLNTFRLHINKQPQLRRVELELQQSRWESYQCRSSTR